MAPRERPPIAGPSCWLCGAAASRRRIDTECVLRVRSADEGGPYRVWTCRCGAECGALRNRAGDWLLHPLEGLGEPGILDRLVPPHSRETQRAAVEWWLRHAGDVERFRRATTPVAGPGDRGPPPRAERRGRRRAGARPPPPPSPPPRRTGAEADARSPHELLGVAPGAGAKEIRAAYRKALKLCHPDRVANLDVEIQELAHRKSKALRVAYEQLLRDAGGGD